MHKFLTFYVLLTFCLAKIFAVSISTEEAVKLADKIWKNESRGTFEGLTHWNKGENFVSLGIGHFIWYVHGQKERFEETFPLLLAFLKTEKVSIPEWLKNAQGCPWKSREEFYESFQSAEMKNLRTFLFETRNLQAVFIAKRLENTCQEILESAEASAKNKIDDILKKLFKKAEGMYALADYLNFKGSGLSLEERYRGQGWGLLQVLEGMSSDSKDPLLDFVNRAKFILTQRVQNAPVERHEEIWLKGWLNRLDTYLKD